jgi:hypothetical protein
MAKKSWLVSLALLLVGVGCSIEAVRLGLGSVHRPGIGFLPLLVGSCLAIIALYSLIIDVSAALRARTSERLFSGSWVKVVAVVCCLGLYIPVLPVAGYLLATFLLFIFLFRIGGVRTWSLSILAALLTASISYVVFGFLLNIRFPKGFPGL